jgi:hypothetical protein
MLAAGAVLRLLTGADAFALASVAPPTLHWTAAADVSASIQVPIGTNLFEIQTGPIEARLRLLPAVAAAHVAVSLPHGLTIAIEERTPILAWRTGSATWLVDATGVVFAAADAAEVAASKVPTVVDARAASEASLALGATLDPVEFDAAARLAALVPADVGSVAKALAVRIDDDDGFVVTSGSGSWVAVFGPYSATLRSVDLIPGQVRLLRSLLAGREATVARVLLASDTTGTYVPKPTAKH